MISVLQGVAAFGLALRLANAFNFAFESDQLTDADIKDNPDVSFPSFSGTSNTSRCKTYPGDASWPSEAKWTALNASLGGALIKGIPPAAACYDGPYYDANRCTTVKMMSFSTLLVVEDPVIPDGQWQLGNPCPVPMTNSTPPISACNLTSFPAYVVSGSSVKNIQMGINFARNNNIRLTIKNTGHDYLGRSTGGGALQIWTHPLKGFEYMPTYEMGQYQGQAAKVGSALMQYELHQYMDKYNITVLAPGSTTVGSYGGFMGGGGFSTMLTSKLGLMADQILSFEIVTANGDFLHADPEENEDIFWAVRGGGPGNYGVVTSLVVKAYPTLPVSQGIINFQTGPIFFNTTTTVQVSSDVFWKGVATYFSWLPEITDAKGVGWNFISGFSFNGTRSLTFTGQVNLPGYLKDDAEKFVAPIIKDLNSVGVGLPGPNVRFSPTYPGVLAAVPGEGVSNSRFGSHLFPRESFNDTSSAQYNATMTAIRSFVEEGGYSFHSVDYAPTEEVAGWPGTNSAVSPHLRKAMMHATGFDTHNSGPDRTPQQQIESHARLNEYVNKWRAASPTSGAYMNEADTEEPNFKESFYGANYDRLLDIKRDVDPWDVFYAVTGVGSDRWFSEGVPGLPTQQGRLCRVTA